MNQWLDTSSNLLDRYSSKAFAYSNTPRATEFDSDKEYILVG